MKALTKHLCFILIIASLGCTSTPTRNYYPVNFNKIAKKVIAADTTQSYALYVPTGYSKNNKYPLILLFDSHADGTLAVEKFKEAAEALGYILAGSNNAGNGVANTDQIAQNLLMDVVSKFPIDEKRIYTAGFSGGARIAISFALNSGKIKGIIACSAGPSANDPLSTAPKIDLYGVAGFEDFNYKEIAHLPENLSATGWRTNIDLFDGGHAWPPAASTRKAVLWLELNAVKDKLIPKDKALVEATKDSMISEINIALQSKQFLKAERMAKSAISFLETLTSTNTFEERLAEIQKMPGYASEKEKQATLLSQEEKLMQAYMESFIKNDTSWWKNEVNLLHEEINKSNDLLYTQMLKRIQGFMGIIAYSYISNAVKSNDLVIAEKLIPIYRIIEPKNPDCYFFYAILLDKKGKTKEAAASLQKSIELGFTEKPKVRTSFSKAVLDAVKM
jgi:predicted esterase